MGFIPLVFFVLALFAESLLKNAFLFSSILTGITFLSIGAVKGIVVNKHKIRSALETLLIGGVASVIAFFVGYFLRSLVG